MNRKEKAKIWLQGTALATAFVLPFSIALAQMAAGAAIVAWIVAEILDRRTGERMNPFTIPLAAFSLVAIWAAVYGGRMDAAFPKLHRLLWFLLIFVMPAAARRARGGSAAGACHLLYALLAGASVQALIDLVRIPASLLRIPSGANPVFWLFSQGSMRTPQFYLVTLCFLLAAGGVARWAVSRPRLWWGLLALQGAGLLLHFKRGSWMAFGGAVLIFTVQSRRWRWLAFLALVSAAALLVPPVRARVASLRDDQYKPGSRVEMWEKAAPKLLQKYPRGMGWGAMTNGDLQKHIPSVIEPKLNHLHSNVYQIAVELGRAGIAVWLAWMALFLGVAGSAAARLRKTEPGGWVACGVFSAACGLLLNGIVEYNFGAAPILMLFALLMGISVALRRAASAG